MNQRIFFFIGAALLLLLPACDRESAETTALAGTSPRAGQAGLELKSEREKLSYALGQEIGTTLEDLKDELDLPAFHRGLEDVLTGRAPLLTPEQAQEVKLSFLARLQEERQRALEALGEENLRAGQAFLAENKMREDVVTTASGLQYMVLEKGDGPRPTLTDTVRVHYRGSLLDGTTFDDSFARGEPALFKVDEVIPGWAEGLQLMRVGGRYRFFIPADLAYGEQGAGPQVGPQETLIFEIELLEIVQDNPAPQPMAPIG